MTIVGEDGFPVESRSLASFRAVVTGRVQGVYFRAFVQQHAASLRLKGYVRNLRGSRAVEVIAEGGRDQLEELVRHLRRGPAGARVDELKVDWREYSGDFLDFDIRY